MAQSDDPALYSSGFERFAKDRYWTHPWLTNVLLRHVNMQERPGIVWEPAAGRGDIANVLLDHGLDVFASDIDLSEFDGSLCECANLDFLDHSSEDFDGDFDPDLMGLTSVITNPPYDKAVDFCRKALEFENIRLVAMLLRAEFGYASSRVDLFTEQPFAFEIKLTTRPRWDWWFRDRPEASPRHNFSWFVWDRDWQAPPTIYWAGKPKQKKA